MLKVEQALKIITSEIFPLGDEVIPLGAGMGRVVSGDIKSRTSNPPFAISAMDGYALKSSDTILCPKLLTKIGVSRAGKGFKEKLRSGETVRIYTGAPIPKGADSIVIQEDVNIKRDKIEINETVDHGSFVRPAGLDFSCGETMIKGGVIMSARDIGLLAAMNILNLRVKRKPRVAIIATGDEIVMPGDPLKPGQIISSNSISLSNYVEVFGGTPVNIGIAKDSDVAIRDMINQLNGFDLILTVGGASVGDYDLVRKVIEEREWSSGFYKVAMRPGKPTFFGRLDGIPLLGLPGNPVSAGVVSAVFLSVIMGRLLGLGKLGLPIEYAKIACDMVKNGDRQDYLRSSLEISGDGTLLATPFIKQDSSMVSNLANAQCLLVRPPLANPVKAGDAVKILMLAASNGCSIRF